MGGAGGAGDVGGAGGVMQTTSTATGTGGDIIITSGVGGGDAGTDDVMVNPCGTQCGPKELCDTQHVGLDDDCDGLVDEDCGCSAGQVHACFKGDPSYHNVPGCFDGSQKCSENGMWGPCLGGVHATAPDNCYNNDQSSCHPISARPFADVLLKTGTGNFSANAVPGTEVWTVDCPQGVDPCPAVTAPDKFKPLQSGEYTVTYTKGLQGGGTAMCTYPLFVGAPGLRVELTWEHPTTDTGVDLDLHVHKPGNTLPWGISPGAEQDCTWSNCVISDFQSPSSNTPEWFAPPPAVPPQPVNWWLDPVMANHTCYYAPRGVGQKWQNLGKGCHNPRLDLDNVTCDATVTDPNSTSFCAPENVNIDFPPQNQWTRVGVHYYSSHSKTYDVHPTVKIFCNGALAAELGPQGYYSPEAPVTFEPSDGTGTANRFWMVADVAFTSNQCGSSFCVVNPIYANPAGKTPFFTLDDVAETTFAPAYPPPP